MAALPLGAFAGESAQTLVTPTGTLYGTLMLPPGQPPYKVVFIIAGSGSTDRNGNSPMLPGKNDTYKLLAASLAQKGIASLRYDKRGIAESAPAMTSENELRFDTYVEDAAGWMKQLRADKRFSKLTVAGHSEGSLVGMLAAQRVAADGYVSLEGAGRPAPVVLREQLKKNLPPTLYPIADGIIARLQQGQTVDAVPPEFAALFRASVQPYLISWFKYDPAAEIAKVSAPATIVQGTADVQVTMADAQALAKGDPRAKLVVVQGMNHVLKYAPDTSSQTAILKGYEDASLPVDPKAVGAVASAV